MRVPIVYRIFALLLALISLTAWRVFTSNEGWFIRLEPQVMAVYPHDTGVFTQGLLWHEGVFYESGGLYGASSLRRVDVQTGQAQKVVSVPPQYFAEGLALIPEQNRLIQLTWQEGVALVYDRDTFDLIGTFAYETEGWGLCYDGEHLYMSDGSDRLTVRDPLTFEVIDMHHVTLGGVPVYRLNELACVGDWVYANVWMTNDIVRINKHNGRVRALIDAGGLIPTQERRALGWGADAVLNGIAYNPDEDLFYLTGKLWDRVFVVRFMVNYGWD